MTKFRDVAVAVSILSLGALTGCASSGSHGSNGQVSQASRPAQQELSPGMVQQVQTSLLQKGLYSGSVDGIWGPATQTAVRSYQGTHGLIANGQIDSPTLASLNLASDGTVPASGSSTEHGTKPAPVQTDTTAPTPAPAQADTPAGN